MKKSIKIKPHHFIDVITSFSEDKLLLKPHYYKHRVHSVTKEIIENRDLILEIELNADDICEPCIHNIKGICDDTLDISNRPKVPSLKREWNLILDKRWCKRLKLEQGDKISVSDFCELLKDSSNNLLEIYKENDKENTAKREINLKIGLQKYLTSNITYSELLE